MSMPTSAVIAQSIFALLNVPAVPYGYGCSSSSRRRRLGRWRRCAVGGAVVHASASKSSSCISVTLWEIAPSIAASAAPTRSDRATNDPSPIPIHSHIRHSPVRFRLPQTAANTAVGRVPRQSLTWVIGSVASKRVW